MRIYTPDKHAFKDEWVLDYYPMWEYLSEEYCVVIVDGKGELWYYEYSNEEKCKQVCEEIKQHIKNDEDYEIVLEESKENAIM